MPSTIVAVRQGLLSPNVNHTVPASSAETMTDG